MSCNVVQLLFGRLIKSVSVIHDYIIWKCIFQRFTIIKNINTYSELLRNHLVMIHQSITNNSSIIVISVITESLCQGSIMCNWSEEKEKMFMKADQ